MPRGSPECGLPWRARRRRRAAELAEDSPGLELGVCPFAECAEFRVGPVGLFLRFRLVPAPVRDLRVAASLVALIGQHNRRRPPVRPGRPDPLGFLVVDCAGQCPGHPQDVAARAGDDLQVHPVLLVLSRVEGPVCGNPVRPGSRCRPGPRRRARPSSRSGPPGGLRRPGPRAGPRSPPHTARRSRCRPRTRLRARRTSHLSAGKPGREAPAAQGSASASATPSTCGGGG